MIGIDIEEVKRFKKVDMHLIERVYTKNEIEYCNNFSDPHLHLAGIWCAKEAVVKCLTDLNLLVSEIEILHTTKGTPYVRIGDKLKEYFRNNNIKAIHISISHTKKLATAIAMLQK